MRKISLAVAVALSAAAVMSAAGEFSAGGLAYFDITSYDQKQSNGEDSSSFLSGTVSMDYKSGALGNGLSYNLGGIMNRKIWENNEGDWLYGGYSLSPRPIDDTVFHTANITWSNDLATVVAGRQGIELEWLGDYHEAIVGVLKPTKEFTIIAGYTQAYGTADYDGYNSGFAEIKDFTDANGAFAIDVAIDVGGGLSVEPWFYMIPDTANMFGGKVAIEQDPVSASLAYTIGTDESNLDLDNASFLHFTIAADATDSLKVLAGAAMTQSKTNPTPALTGLLGENISPFEDGNYFFFNDTMTIYAGVEYESGKLTLGALGGLFNSGNKARDLITGAPAEGRAIEIDLSAGYAVTDTFSVKGIIVDQLGGSKDHKNDDYLSIRLAAIYNYGGK